MKISAKSPPLRGVLQFEPAPAALAAYAPGFVFRDDPDAGGVVRWLPELRASVQIMLADPVWSREAGSAAQWAELPRVGLWGPRYDWAYGYARARIRAYAFGLTALGLRALTGSSAAILVNTVQPLHHLDPVLADRVTPRQGENFACWCARAAEHLISRFAMTDPGSNPVAAALPILATADANAVARAAEACGMSQRHFRRELLRFHGVSPKRWQRAVRVDRTLRQLHAAPWEEDAYAEPAAFSDQPHAIREFRRFIGATPREYFRSKRTGDLTLRSLPVEGVDPPETQHDE